jgi:hypothetical protein
VLSGRTMSRVPRAAFWGYPLVHVARDLKHATDWILRREGL